MSLESIRSRDEVLQVMYWMLGENIAHEVDAAYLARFLAEPVGAIGAALTVLERDGLVVGGGGPGSYRLSREGMREGGRRFLDEFGDITKQAHGECAPGCTCHTPEGAGKPCPTTGRVAEAHA
ncbi:hypothetical protein BH18CHL2_BH18CHL2_08710 [soil metagenome]